MSDSISIIVNGDKKDVPSGINVIRLLAQLGLPLGRVAIERKLDILPRDQWESTEVAPDAAAIRSLGGTAVIGMGVAVFLICLHTSRRMANLSDLLR